ncbi:DNA polymerase III subunit gamma/tau [Sphingobium sp. DEHP117]|uniref:DNA polymerase III subunit gamma/tau n=1 Tax=Sphingobium sp. DEHP117 TaxID=2993436 RepID=UPI0027D552FF|nr:DNA polymerase III subunit gamma/tau [Sphingobium sp. DEHP117]MDQ4420099.1 DNA polymerase III subunit gamma/tau [Sphingobium sp. DEHP117]
MTDSPPTTGSAYRVLARKYRPQTFAELIGQDAMVQTLGNAIRRGRLAHAFLMTGVRGVGKTSTARLIAKALNCIGPDGQGGPTIDPCGQCEPCLAIAEGRHIDVIEMDAASHTGVDDVREIIEAVRYSAVSARYKVYIIDEVHMLSKNAFNALLKTLEEPPAHVKFLFATTEVNKVPVTVLSRCQRFDLRRISAEKLAAHFAHVVREEGVEAEAEALSLIAQAAEGSARDGLSILDQAIAHAETEGAGDGARVTAAQVREMLGLSDRGAIRRLFGLLLAGDASGALALMREQHDLGVEPLSILRGLLETVHGVTLLKAGGKGDDPAQSVEEREALADWASQLGFAPLHRLWQLLLKGHEEVARAAMPTQAADMALLRVIHAASLPDPSELARLLEGGAPAASAPNAASSPAAAPSSAPTATLPASFEALVKLLWDRNKGLIADEIEHFVRPIRYAPPELDFEPARPMAQDQIDHIRVAIDEVTRGRWQLRLAQGEAEPTLSERREQAERQAKEDILSHPVMQAALAAFPDAELLPADDEAKWSESA